MRLILSPLLVLLALPTAQNAFAQDDPNAYRQVPISDGAPSLKWVGRFLHLPDGDHFSWSGSEIVARFIGTSLEVTLTHSGTSPHSPVFFTAIVDGRAAQRFSLQEGTQKILLASHLSASQVHDVMLMRETEGWAGVSIFQGFDFGPGGALLAPYSPTKQRMEIIGDSISAGYGVLGTTPGCHFTTETESAFSTYGSRLSRALGMDLTTIAYSGKGVLRNYQGQPDDPSNPTMFHDFLYALTPHIYTSQQNDEGHFLFDFSSVTPADLVLINLGTNDFASGPPNEPDFTDAYVRLLRLVRAHYPAAEIVSTLGPMMSGDPLSLALIGIQNACSVLARAGDSKIHFLPLMPQDPAIGTGCDTHPNVAEAAVMAATLLPGLEKLLQRGAHPTWDATQQ